MEIKNKVVHFPGLNGIRAIAAITVLFWHLDEFSCHFDIKPFGYFVNGFSRNAVDMFFVLSGFLITFLLLKEKESSKTIDIRKFYYRRILRIWPLYYLAVIITFIMIYFNMIPEPENLKGSMFFYLFLMANVAFFFKMAIPSILPLWSVGVEEQFYMFWPWIIRKSSKYLITLGTLFSTIHFLRLLGYFELPYFKSIYGFLNITRIDIMILGAAGAVLVYKNKNIIKIFYRIEIQIIAWLLLIQSYIFGPVHVFSFFDYQLNAFIYLIIILNVATNKKSLLKLDNALFKFFGKISYGLYVYHMLIVYFLAYLFKDSKIVMSYFGYVLLIFSLTTLVSYFSYNYFEKPFLRIKNKFTVIKSSALDNSGIN